MSQYTQDPIAISLYDRVQSGAGEAGPGVARNSFDVLRVSGKLNPGIVTISGADRPYWIDVQHAPGSQGNLIFYRGWDKVENIQCKFTFWQDGQIEQFYRDYMPAFTNNGRPVGVDVEHPILKANDITKLLLKNTGQLTPDDKRGLWSVTLGFVEYRKAKAISAEPASGASGPNNNPTAKDKLDVRILRLRQMSKKRGI